MTSWLNKDALFAAVRDWFGIGSDYAITDVGFRSPFPVAALAALVALAVAFTAWMYWQEKALPRWLRVLLTVLRSVVYSVVLLFLFCPYVSLERQVTIRRNLLVLLDRSRSMGIEDKRATPESLADAALALGKAAYPLPAEHEALVRARRTMQRTAEALGDRRREDALRSLAETDAAFADLLQRPKEAAPAPPEAGPVLEAARAVEREQKGLREAIEKFSREGGLTAERYKEVAATQAAIAEKTAALVERVRQTVVAVAPETQGQVAQVSRMALARGLLTNPGARVLERVSKGCRVNSFVFGDKLAPVGDGVDALTNALASAKAADESTRGGEAVEEAVARHSGQPLAGVVLLTDGAFNAGADALEIARRMKEQGVPLYPLGLGIEAPRDVGLRSLIAPEVVFPEDKVNARVQLFSNGFRGAQADVRLYLDGKEAAARTVELSDAAAFVDLAFEIPKEMAGARKLAVAVAAQPGEQTEANNRIERTIKVIDQKIKVLYVEGKPRWEYRYLRVVLQRDQRLDVKFLMTQGDKELAGSSPEYVGRYPDNPGEAFQFDLVILGDIPAWYFDQAQMERIVQHVRERGGSLLMMAGDRYAPATYVNTPIAEVLPVRITEDPPGQVPPEWRPSLTPAGRRAFTMIEGTDAATDALWRLVGPLYRLPSLTGAKPAANVLLGVARPEGGEPYPLLAWHYAGTGKVMFLGTDQLWRLRFMRGDHYHVLFWGKTIQFMALSRLLGENKRVRLETDRAECRAGEKVELHANVLDDSFQPTEAAEYGVRLERVIADTASGSGTNAGPGVVAGTVPVKLAPVPGTPGLYHGIVRLEEEGQYRLKARPEDVDFANTVHLTVASSDREQQEPAMQEELLRKMAEVSGGRYFTIRDWPALPGVIEGRERSAVEKKDKDIWDIWPLYVLVLSCAGLEWFIRRRRHLV